MAVATPEEIADWTHYIEVELMGSCRSIESDPEREHLLNNAEFCQLLDGLIFNCEVCNWWCELSEMAADGNQHGICTDCHDEDEDD